MDRSIPGQSKSGQPEPPISILDDDSILPNGCIRCHPLREEPADDCDSERVGVLDYMPVSRHTTADASRNVALHRHHPDNRNADSADCVAAASHPDDPKNIELTTFRITECRSQANPATCSSCASDDDELLCAAEAEDDYLHEVVVESQYGGAERLSRAISGIGRASPDDREVSTFLRCIPSFGAKRDGAWPRPETDLESPAIDLGESVSHDLEEDDFATYRVSSYEGRCCVATTRMDSRDDEALEDRSLHHDAPPTAAPDDEVRPGSTGPVEVVNVDRSSVDHHGGSMSRSSNVLYLNDYSLWTSAARAFCRDEVATSDRSEVVKRQERRARRRERRGVERTVKAEEIEGYIGMKEVEDLLEYIQGETEKSGERPLPSSGKRETGRMARKSKGSDGGSAPRPRVMSEGKPAHGGKTPGKDSSEMLEAEEEEEGKKCIGGGTAPMETSGSVEGTEEGNEALEEEGSSTLAETAVSNRIQSSSSPSRDPGRTSTRSSTPGVEDTTRQSTPAAAEFHSTTADSSGKQSAPKSEQMSSSHGSKASKKQKHHIEEVADQTARDSDDKVTSTTPKSPSHDSFVRTLRDSDDIVTSATPKSPSSHGSFVGATKSGTVDDSTVTLSEDELSTYDSSVTEESQSRRHPSKSSSTQDKGLDMGDDWTVHKRRGHPRNRARPDESDDWTVSQGEQNPAVWKDQPSKPTFIYRRPEGRGAFGRVGSIGDGYQGPKAAGRGRRGSTSSLNLENSNGAGRVGSRVFWGSRDPREIPRGSVDLTRFPDRRSHTDEVQGGSNEGVTYARITAGEAVGIQGTETVSRSDVANEVLVQMEEEEAEWITEEQDAGVVLDPDGTGKTGSQLSEAGADTGGAESTPGEQPRNCSVVESITAKQVAMESAPRGGLATPSKEPSRSTAGIPSTSNPDGKSEVAGRSLAEVVGSRVAGTQTKSKDGSDVSLGVSDGDGNKTWAKAPSPVSLPRRNAETKTKPLPVEFSRRFKGGKVDGLSFGFDPTVADSKSQGSLSFSDFGPEPSVSNRVVSGTTMVPAGGGLQSQGCGTSVANCSRPIAPLSGPGHASGAKTPVVVVNPMQLARGPAEPPSQTIVRNDADLKILKEVADAVRIAPGNPPKVGDISAPVDSTRPPPGFTVPTQSSDSPVRSLTFVEESQHNSGSRSVALTHRLESVDQRHQEPRSLAQFQFLPPSAYILYKPCPQLPNVASGVYRPGVAFPPAGPDAPPVPSAPALYLPRSTRDEGAVRSPVPLPIQSLALIQNYIHNEFLKVLDEERRGPTKVIRYKED